MHSRRKKLKRYLGRAIFGRLEREKERGGERERARERACTALWKPTIRERVEGKRKIDGKARFVNHMNTPLEKYNFILGTESMNLISPLV